MERREAGRPPVLLLIGGLIGVAALERVTVHHLPFAAVVGHRVVDDAVTVGERDGAADVTFIFLRVWEVDVEAVSIMSGEAHDLRADQATERHITTGSDVEIRGANRVALTAIVRGGDDEAFERHEFVSRVVELNPLAEVILDRSRCCHDLVDDQGGHLRKFAVRLIVDVLTEVIDAEVDRVGVVVVAVALIHTAIRLFRVGDVRAETGTAARGCTGRVELSTGRLGTLCARGTGRTCQALERAVGDDAGAQVGEARRTRVRHANGVLNTAD